MLNDEVQFSRRILFDYENRSLNSSIRMSKYLFKLRSTIGAGISWQKANTIQLQNGNRLNYENITRAFVLTVNSKISNWANISYQGTVTMMSSQQKGIARSALNEQLKLRQIRQNAELNVTPGSLFIFKLKMEDYYNEAKNIPAPHTVFLDAAITFRLKKMKSDIELSCLNLAGKDQYVLTSLLVNSLLESSYPLRPRMIMLKTYFRF